ncbi:hypothetical protein P167DRAFT_566414 [Morchella conica CCBAS932]|uniref:Uncharacterized protein n=1 Tax=Morchella conica CCBAS932 TaxID=1392247 RepID=A0A3N4KMT8_9PEZI|nr:hypothetical protein P167DRAFT_566414 [Morchella conica CCBAS932]
MPRPSLAPRLVINTLHTPTHSSPFSSLLLPQHPHQALPHTYTMQLLNTLPLALLTLATTFSGVSANWFYARQEANTTISGTNTTITTNGTLTNSTLGYNSTTAICDDPDRRAECCDVYPDAMNCPVGPTLENTSTYDAGGGVVDDHSGGTIPEEKGAAAGRGVDVTVVAGVVMIVGVGMGAWL